MCWEKIVLGGLYAFVAPAVDGHVAGMVSRVCYSEGLWGGSIYPFGTSWLYSMAETWEDCGIGKSVGWMVVVKGGKYREFFLGTKVNDVDFGKGISEL